MTDESSGHRYRVSFDPASRVTLAVAGEATRNEEGKVVATAAFQGGLAYRSISARGAGKELVSWQIEHRVLTGRVAPWAGPRAGLPGFDAAAYGIFVLRHDERPTLVLPSSPPVGVPFPFDVGFDAEVGRAAMSALSGSKVVHVGVVRAGMLVDPWRSRERGRIFALGVGARYDIDVAMGGEARLTHWVAPMTAGSVRFRFESGDGLFVVDARAEAAGCMSSDRAWRPRAEGSLHLERTLIAIADQPVSAFLDGGARLLPSTGGAPPPWDFHAGLGLALHLSLR